MTEALTNIAKHAGAAEAAVHITTGDGLLSITVQDDGGGGADPSRGSGLNGLRDRLQTLNGSLQIDSPPGGGTRLIAVLPAV